MQKGPQRWAFGFVIVLALFGFQLSMTAQTASQTDSKQGVPDAPSAVRPPQPLPKPSTAPAVPLPSQTPPDGAESPASPPNGSEGAPAGADTGAPPGTESNPDATTPDNGAGPTPPFNVKTVPPGTAAPPTGGEQLFKIVHTVNQVIVPVMVKDDNGHLVAGLLPKDFVVYENGAKQKMNFFTSDPFAMSVAVVFDIGMPDVAVQKVLKTLPALQGAFSQFDEVAVYTYSSTYAKVSDFTGVGKVLAARLNTLKDVTGRNNGPAVTGGPLGPQGPTVNGIPIDPGAPTVYTPPREAHVLNDAVLRAAVDLSKRDPTRRKVIFIISDGREYGSTASYRDVLRVLLSNGILVYGIGTEAAAIPGYNKLKLHIPKLGYTDILPKYANATGGEIFAKFSQEAIESAYSRAIGDARNQYTLGYVTPVTPSSSYREITVDVRRPSCKNSDERPCVDVFAKAGYYPAPPPPQ